MGNYSVIDVLFLLGIAQGLFLSVTLPIVHKNNIAANKVLAVQIVLACLTLFTRMVIYKADDIGVIQRFALFETFIFVFGPLGFIYLKRLLENKQARFKLPWFHYLPAIFYLAYLIFINGYSSQEFRQRLISGEFRTPFFIAELSALLFNLFYWYLNYHFFLAVLKKEKEQLSFNQGIIPFVRIMIKVIGIILLAWLLSFCSKYIFHYVLPLVNYNMVWITIPILIYIVGYFALKQPEIFRVSITKNKSKDSLKSIMGQKHIEQLQKRLIWLMEEEKNYLNNELTLAELAEKLDTSTNKLSWLLNNVHKSNFYDFINEYRIKEFITKLEQNEHKVKTLYSLSMEVGFNSKSTFNKAFKASLKETPSSYIKKHAG